jgi:4-aminobutyrate aminotransferase-like enzyme
MGTDVFAPAGTPVRAPLAGVVRDRQNRTAPLDYGGVLVLEHATAAGEAFWTLYGHLDPDSLAPGDAVEAGDMVGTLGAEDVNGGWPPHLHLQLATHLLGGSGGDLPGVVVREDAELWRSVFPDPNLLLGAAAGDAARVERDAREIAARRRVTMSAAMSVAYREPLHIVGGAGAHLHDADGNAWLDLVNNVAHVGHGHPRVVAAGQRQMAALNTNTRYLHDSVVEYARRLTATLPDPLNVCFFVNSGSEANDLALRLARAHTGREDAIVLDHAYHGHLSSLIALSPYKFDRPGGRGKPATTHVAPLPDPYRGRFGADAGAYADAVRELCAGEPAAFFAESLQSCGGQVVYPPGYLTAAFAHVRASGGVCVADEVQVGFGRVGEAFWGFELQGAVPDIVTMGKPIGNGHPLAAVVTTPEIAASFVTGMEYFNTFGGNPVSAEIGLAVLDVIADERLQAAASARGEQLLAGLRALDHPLIGDVRGHGLFLGVELSRDGRAPAAREAAAVKEALKARGILISTDGPDDNVLKIKPPLVISSADCDRFLDALAEALPAIDGLASSLTSGG